VSEVSLGSFACTESGWAEESFFVLNSTVVEQTQVQENVRVEWRLEEGVMRVKENIGFSFSLRIPEVASCRGSA